MNRYLLLILLSSWAHVVPLSLQCETGEAYPKHVLSVGRSLLANADVAIIRTYKAETLNMCITDCCTEKFGLCSVASFRNNNDTQENCQHFNCRPVQKCKFLSSNSTDSFSFSSSPSTPALVPSSNASKNDSFSSTVASVAASESKADKLLQNSLEHPVTTEAVTTYSEEHFALKDDNTTIKPRKGVDEVTENSSENVSRSGVKPRKGVSLDGLTNSNNLKSKVKPRKGVGPFQSQSISPTSTVKPSLHAVSTESIVPNAASKNSMNKDTLADDIVSALEKVFEDDSKVNHVNSSIISPAHTTETNLQSSATVTNSLISTSRDSIYTSTSIKSSSTLQPSLINGYTVSSTVRTPDLTKSNTPTTQTVDIIGQFLLPSPSRPSILEHSEILFRESDVTNDIKSVEEESDTEESESQRKYKSSMHLVLSLVFGLLVLFSVLGVVAKRMYDNWVRRQYRRLDFLIDGMYNAYG